MRADKEKAIRQLKTARGQIEGIMKMVEENRYCIDISNQLLATQAILKSINRDVIKAHMSGCVEEAFISGNGQEKIDEIMELIDKLTK